MSLREEEKRMEVGEFVDASKKIDGFRTHKYRQFKKYRFVVASKARGQVEEIEGNSLVFENSGQTLFVKINEEPDEFDLTVVKRLEGSIFKLTFRNPNAWDVPITLWATTNADLDIDEKHTSFSRFLGALTEDYQEYLITDQFGRKFVFIANTHDYESFEYEVWGYIKSRDSPEDDVGNQVSQIIVAEKTTLAAQKDKLLRIPEHTTYLRIKLSHTFDSSYEMHFIGEYGESSEIERALKSVGRDSVLVEDINRTGDLISERINWVGRKPWHFISQVVKRYISITVENMGSNTEIYIGSEGVGKLCTQVGDSIEQLPVSNAAQIYVWGNSTRQNGVVSYIGV